MAQQLNVVVEAGNPPDVALVPQPGAVKKFAADGKIIPLPAGITAWQTSSGAARRVV